MDTYDKSREKIESVQVLRAIAALAVAVAHFHHEFLEVPGGIRFGLGQLGVNLFFVISGFIMVYTCWSMFGQKNASANFFLRRIIRIVPLYWAASLATLYLVIYTQPLAQADLSPSSILGSFVFFPVARPSGSFVPLLTVGWTLNLEMLFYTIFAVSLLFKRSVAIIFATLILFMIALDIIRADIPAWKFWSSPLILDFVFGMFVAVLFKLGLRISRRTALLALTIGTSIVIARHVMVAYNIPLELPLRGYSVGFGMSLILIGTVLYPWDIKGRLTSFLSELGDVSYSIYILHPLLLWPHVILGMYGIIVPVKNITYCSLVLALSIALSIVSFHYIERPLSSWLGAKINHFFPINMNYSSGKKNGAESCLAPRYVERIFNRKTLPALVLLAIYVAYVFW